MQKSSKAEARRSLLLSIFVLGLVTAMIVVPYQFVSEAGSQKKAQGLIQRTTSHEEGLDYYDIRADKAGTESIMEFRRAAGSDAVAADIRSKFDAAEADLRRSVPTLKVENNPLFSVPELIAPDILKGRAFLTSPSSEKRSTILRDFAKTNRNLIGMGEDQIDQLKVTADYTNPDGNLSFASLEQFINGIPVFRGEIKAGFTRRGEMYRAVNNLASGLDYGSLAAADFGDPAEAVRTAATNVKAEVDMTPNAAESTDLKAVFGGGHYPATASKYYFPIEPGLARATWYVIVWKPVNAYEMIIDAETQQILWRQNMAKDQTQSVTYNVWANTTSPMRAMDSPAPLSPGPIDPSTGTQGTLQPRISVSLIGNEAPNTFNNNGWINDGSNTTEGNNTLAGLDRATPNGVDAPIAGSSNRVFNFASNPPPGNPAPGEDPLPAGQTPTPCQAAPPVVNDFQRAAVTQMFYVVNRLHDYMYLHGFTEQARNFQLDNFGRGGTGNDRVLSEGQDCAGTNNANFASSSTDGTVGRMQMFLWTLPTPDRDGTLDGDIIIHEIGHGITNRLHTGGISGTQGGQMHEGNGDFLAHTLNSETSDPINGTYSMGGYATFFIDSGPPFNNTANYYYGIRRYPKAVIAFTGGPLNRPHNPMTYADIDPAQFNIGNGAFAPAFTGSATAVHDGGEIWSSMLWEVRAKLVTRLGHTAGTSKMVQLMVDGMKLAVSTSTMLNSRNSILAAAQASAASPETGADVADVWAGFAARGMGFGAANPSGNTVVESFGLPNAAVTDPVTVSDSPGDNDGILEPGEPVIVSVPVGNITGSTVNNVQVSVNGGPNTSYGNIANGATVTNQIPVTIPAALPCGDPFVLSIVVTSDLGAQPPALRNFQTGAPLGGLSENFDGVTAPALPAGWTTIQDGGATPPALWTTRTTTPASPPNETFTNDPATNGASSLVSPTFAITSSAAKLKFKIDHDTEDTWDGAVLEIKIGAGAFQDILAAGGSFATYPYTDTLGNFAPCVSAGTPNPLATRSAWSGLSGGYQNVEANLPAAANGQNVQFRVRMGSDCSVSDVGVSIDDVQVVSGFACDYDPGSGGGSARGDFDDDDRTDIAVWRPSDGNWHISRSTDGYVSYAWGTSGDQITPGDYDADGKADVAVYRPSTGTWFILNSNGGTYSTYSWGGGSDVAVAGDYDDDGHTDVAVRRPSTGEYFILKSSGGTQTSTWGNATDTPVVGDFDGDGQTDLAVWRSSTGEWFINRSTDGTVTVTWGAAGDRVVHADYDGDGKDDVAVWRGSTGTWFILNSNGGTSTYTWGAAGDVPVPGNYDGDARDDIGVFRNGVWHIDRTTGGYLTASWGIGTDIAVPAEYIP